MSAPLRTEKTVFLEAAEIASPTDRAAYLERSCGDDRQLRAAVEALLLSHQRSQGMLDATVNHEPSIAERPGTIIGPYKLLQQIGEGGMGVVFMAEQSESIQRTVALKIIKPGMDTRQVIARFEAERQAVAMMDHPNIAKVLDAGTTDSGRPYFVMELVKGVPITKYCDDKHLPLRARLELFMQVCQAVQHAHQKGIIHRDIKPNNVLVAEYDHQTVPKVIDFGVAKATAQKLTERTMFTEFGQVIGTMEYMSPEQSKFNQLDIDTRSDIYSLGVMLYELLAGSTPFESKRLKEAAFDEMLRIIREEEPPKPSTRLSSSDTLPSIAANRQIEPARLGKDVRGELDWIVMKALEKDRNRRYETASGFAADIGRHLRDEPVQAGPPSAAYRFRKFARRNKAALAMTTVVAAALVLAVVGLALSTAFITAAYQGEAEQRLLADKNAEEASKNAAEAKQKENEAKVSATETKKQQKIAEEQELLARRRFYAAQMNLAQQAWEAGTRGRVLELLESQRPKFDEEDLRSFEWYYLWRLCHAGQRLRLTGHRGLVAAVAFSPDGKTLATASNGGTIKLWDTITGQERLALSPSTEATCLAFSPDGKLLCVGSWSNVVNVWDVATGRQNASFQFQHWVRSATFSPDSKTLAAGLEHGSVRFWDVSTRTEQDTLQGNVGPVMSVAYSPDGKILATASGWGKDDGKTNLWDLTSKPVRLMRELPAAVTVAFSPDGKMVATSGYFNTGYIKLWDVTTGQEQIAFHGHRGGVMSVAFSPDGKTLASGSEDRTVRLWDIATGQERVQQAHLGVVRSVAFSPDGKTFASGSDDGSAKVWDVATAQDSDTLQHGGAVKSVMFVSDGKNLIAGGDCPTKWWNVPTGQEAVAVQVQMGPVALSPDARTLAALDREGMLRLWDAATGQERAGWQAHGIPQAWASRVVFSPDGKTLASASYRDEPVKLWDVATQQPRGSFQTDAGFPVSLAYSPDGKMLAVGTIHNTVKLWDLATSKEKFAFRVGGGSIEIRSLAFSPDSKMLAAGTALGIVMLWDVQTGQLRASFKGHTAVVGSLAFSRDGKTLATGSGDWTVKLWDVVTGQERVSLKGHKGSVNSITFAPDGKTLATGSDDWTAKLWRAATDQEATAKKTELDLDDPASPAAMNSWRDRLLKAGRMPEAEEAYRQAVSRLDKLAAEFPNVPDYPQDLARSRFALVLLLASSGRPQEAEQAYRQAVDLFEKVAAKLPNTPDFRVELGTSLNNLAWPLATSADPSFRNTGWALDLAKKAVALRPRDTYAWNTLGVAHYCAGDWHAAIDALAKSEELAPGRSFGFNAFFLAMAHWQLGEKDEARNWYDQAVQWMEKNKQQYDELKRFREEAAELLGVKEKKN